jgi:hypothetical protein
MKIKKMKKIILLLIVIALYQASYAQNDISEYKTYKFKYIGNKNNQAIFQYLRKNKDDTKIRRNGAIPGCLYKIEPTSKKQIKFLKYKEIKPKYGNVVFISDKLQISNLFNQDTYNFSIIKNNDTTILDTKLSGTFSSNFSSSNKNDLLFFSGFTEDPNIKMIDFSKKTIKIQNLPLFGLTPIALGDYLYFDFYHIGENKATPCPSDLYRVKIGDWNNPELLVEYVSDSWLPLNDSTILLTLPIKGRGKQVFYNIKNNSYVETNKKLSTEMIKYENKKYLLGTERDNKGNKKYVLQAFPEIPEDGYKPDDKRDIPQRVMHVNLSNHEKEFKGTFITDNLLYNASREKLQDYTKKELRLLRNAFFAREGYNFRSDDLKTFFSQFKWYNQLLKSNSFFEISNEDIVLSPKDKERVELILEIEKDK